MPEEDAKVPLARRHPGCLGRLFALAFLGFSLLGWLRVWQAVTGWAVLVSYGVYLGPGYLAASGALWGIAGLPAAWALWTGRSWALAVAWAAGLVYAVTFWIDRLAFSPGAPFQNWPFALGVTLLAALALAVLTWRLPRQPFKNGK